MKQYPDDARVASNETCEGGDEDDDLDRAIVLFAKLIARQRELLARLSRDLTRQDHQQIERAVGDRGHKKPRPSGGRGSAQP
jgi:hypothetical protein